MVAGVGGGGRSGGRYIELKSEHPHPADLSFVPGGGWRESRRGLFSYKPGIPLANKTKNSPKYK